MPHPPIFTKTYISQKIAHCRDDDEASIIVLRLIRDNGGTIWIDEEDGESYKEFTITKIGLQHCCDA